MTTEQLAVLVYGVVAYLVAAILAVTAGSSTALLILFAGAGVTYVFQALQLLAPDVENEWFTLVLLGIWALAVILPVASVLTSIGAF